MSAVNSVSVAAPFSKFKPLTKDKSKSLMIIGECGGEDGCSLSAYRKQSGIKLWEKPLNLINNVVYGEDSDGMVLVVTKEFFDVMLLLLK